MLVIDQGLEAGEQVITQGHMTVMPGGLVQVIPPQGGTPGAPGGANAAASGAGEGTGAGAASGEGSEKKS
jgi:hypothetical protein